MAWMFCLGHAKNIFDSLGMVVPTKKSRIQLESRDIVAILLWPRGLVVPKTNQVWRFGAAKLSSHIFCYTYVCKCVDFYSQPNEEVVHELGAMVAEMFSVLSI